MAKLTVINHVTLDGVMQAPARADEDVRGGFQHGGWALPYGDSVMSEFMGKGMAKGGALLFGRRTYEDFAAVWPQQEGNPVSALLNERPEVRRVDDAARAAAMVATRRCCRATSRRQWAGLKEDSGEDLARARQRRARPVADAPRPRRRVRADDPSARSSDRGAACSPTSGPLAALRLVERQAHDHRRRHR